MILLRCLIRWRTATTIVAKQNFRSIRQRCLWATRSATATRCLAMRVVVDAVWQRSLAVAMQLIPYETVLKKNIWFFSFSFKWNCI